MSVISRVCAVESNSKSNVFLQFFWGEWIINDNNIDHYLPMDCESVQDGSAGDEIEIGNYNYKAVNGRKRKVWSSPTADDELMVMINWCEETTHVAVTFHGANLLPF